MNIKREQIAEVLLTAGIVAVGFATGNPVISGIGVNWAADLTQAGWGQACRRLLGESGLLNSDLQQAVARAFQQAIAHLEQSWWQTPRGNQMLHNKPEADLAREAFKMLREDAGRFCTPDHLGRVAGNEQVQQLLYGDEATARRALSEHLKTYLHGHDEQLVRFIEAHLVRELAFWFGEELKADRPANNRAWRAFQRWLVEGLQTGLAGVRAEQQEMNRVLQDLRAWAERMDARPPEEREPTGQAALEAALADVRDQLLEAMAREHGLTRTAIEDGFRQVAAGFVEMRAGLEAGRRMNSPADTRSRPTNEFAG